MADNESSHLMWIVIVLALASILFIGIKVAFPSLIGDVIDKMTQGAKDVSFKTDNKIDETDPKWVEKSDYGFNGRFLMDKDGNAVVYSHHKVNNLDAIQFSNQSPLQTRRNDKLKTLDYKDAVILSDVVAKDFFNGNTNLVSIRGLDKWDVSKSKTLESLFANNTSLISLDGVNTWNTSKVENMENTFLDLPSLLSLDLSNWDTSNVTSMSGMFNNAKSLANLDFVANWNVSNVTRTDLMFYGNRSLRTLNLSKWNMSKVTSIFMMFGNTPTLTSIGDVSNWDTSNVASFTSMFVLSGISSLDLSKWNTVRATDMRAMFKGAGSLTSVGDLSKWNTSNVTNLIEMFSGTSNLKSIGDISKWDVSKIEPRYSYGNVEGASMADSMFLGSGVTKPVWFVEKDKARPKS